MPGLPCLVGFKTDAERRVDLLSLHTELLTRLKQIAYVSLVSPVGTIRLVHVCLMHPLPKPLTS